MLNNARAAAITEAARHTYRDSPFSPLDNAHPLLLRIDGDTGAVLAEGRHASKEIQIRYQLRPDENRLVLDPETVRGLKNTLDQLKPGEELLKTIAVALLDLPKVPIVLPRGQRPALEAKGTGEGALVLPSPDPAVLKANQSVLGGSQMNNIMMTVMFSGESAAVKHMYQVGTVTLDAEGRIVGTALGRPDFQSPRGTQYRKGLNRGGDEVAVILHGNTVMWHGPLGDLNPRQQSSILALFDATAKQRSRLQTTDAYAVDAILGEGLGKMAMDVSGSIFNSHSYGQGPEPVSLNLRVTRDQDGLLRADPYAAPALAVRRNLEQGTADPVQDLGGIKIRFQTAEDSAKARLLGRLQSFEFTVEPQMEHFQEVTDLLAFLKKSFETPNGH